MAGSATSFQRKIVIGVMGALLGCTAVSTTRAADDFYKGKTIDLVIGYTPGATYDLYARLASRHLGDHIPGNPRIVPRNLAGAGSRVAVNYIYNVAPQDGTVLGTADQSLAVEQAMGDKQLAVDVNKLNWIGNPVVSNNTSVSWYASQIRSVDDARVHEVTMGATGSSTSSQYPRLMNALLGTKFKVILGYPGANDINLAMERGEVAGKGSDSWAAWKATRPDWLRDKKINILVQIGLTRNPEMGDAPLLMDLAKNDEDRQVMKLLSTSVVIGRPLFVGPGVPAERVAMLRRAFDETVKDPEFIRDAKEGKMDLDPVSGEDLQKLIGEIVATPKHIADRLTGIIGGGG